MKNINKLFAPALAALMAAALAVPLILAQSTNEQGDKKVRSVGKGGFHKHAGRPGRGMNSVPLHRLKLTDDQKAQLKQLRQSYRERTQPLHQELRAKMQEMRQSGTFDEALVAQKLTETAPLRAKLMGEQFKLQQETLALLTPEQKTQLEQAREQHKMKREQRHAKRVERQS
jgi:Spy/CpxP family protein refolding chaperone